MGVCSEQLHTLCPLLQGPREDLSELVYTAWLTSCHLQLILGPPTMTVPFNIGSETQTHTLSSHKSGCSLIKTSRQPQPPRVASNSHGLRAKEESQPPASHPEVRLEQPPGPDVFAALMQGTGVSVSEQHLIAQPRAHLASIQFGVTSNLSTRSWWEHTNCRPPGKMAPLLAITTEQCKSACGQHACRRCQKPP